MKIRTLDVEVDGGIASDGLTVAVWIGEGCEPLCETMVTWDEIIDKEIEAYTLPDKETIPYEDESDLHGCFDTVRSLRAAADELEECLLACQAFDRRAWLEANKGDFYGPHTKEELVNR